MDPRCTTSSTNSSTIIFALNSEKILSYHFGLDTQIGKIKLPKGVKWLYPYLDPSTRRVMTEYYDKYYADDQSRTLIFGINPGRFGAGLTGIPFTDPQQLKAICGISNDFPQKPEISAEFIHTVILKFGGLEKFNSQFYISSLCPLGFVKMGVNYNYYDDKVLEKRVTPFIIQNIKAQKSLVNANEDLVYCLGEGKNFQYFSQLNEQFHFFKQIIPLSHPRWIMQYRRKKLNDYVETYVDKLGQSSI